MKPICILDTNHNVSKKSRNRAEMPVEEVGAVHDLGTSFKKSSRCSSQKVYGDRNCILNDVIEFDYHEFRKNFSSIQEKDPLKYELIKGFAQKTEHKHFVYSFDTIRLFTNESNDKILTIFKMATDVTDKAGMLRLHDDEISQFLKIETERLKKLFPIAHLKNQDGGFVFNAEDLFACAKLEEKQLAQVQDIASFGFSPKQIFAIVKDETVNKEALVRQLKKISAIFNDKLEDTQLIKVQDSDKYILRTKSNSTIKGSQEHKTIQILVNNDIEPISMSSNISDLHTSKSKNAIKYRFKISDLHAKTQSQIQNITPKEVEEMAKTVATYFLRASEKEVYTVMQRLTQFASYDSLEHVQKAFSDGHCFCFDKEGSLNSIFNYLQYKSFMDFDSIEDNKVAYLLNKPEPSKLKEALSLGKENLHFLCLDGFDEGVTIFDDRSKLLSKTIAVLRRAKNIVRINRCSLDEALDITLNKKARRVAQENGLEYQIVKNTGFATAESVAKQLNAKIPSLNELDSIIGAISKEYAPRFSKSHTRLLVANYLNDVVDLYSPQRLVDILKNRKTLIEKRVQRLGKSVDDIRYVVLNSDKSYNLITYMYAQTNNIDSRHIIKLDAPRFLSLINPLQQLCEKNPEKCFVILDDIFASGDSVIKHSQYDEFKPTRQKSANIIFSPVSLTTHSKQKLHRLIKAKRRFGKDFVVVEPKQVKRQPNIPKVTFKSVVSELKEVKSLGEIMHVVKANIAKQISSKFLQEGGYKKGLNCTLFPYMTPDNNAKISSIFLQLFVNAQKSMKTTCKDIEKYKFEANIFSLIKKFKP